jgi:hypothetical protein
MIAGTLTAPILSRFSKDLNGATITHVEQRGANVLAVCVSMPDGGASELVLMSFVPYKEPSGSEIRASLISHPRGA